MRRGLKCQRAVFEQILSKYKDAWEKRDPELAGTVCTRCEVQGGPVWQKVHEGLSEIYDYWAAVPRLQKKIRFSHGAPSFKASSKIKKRQFYL